MEQSYNSTLSLTSVLDRVGGQRHASAALPPEKTPGTHCTGGWVDLRAGLDGCGKYRTHRNSIPGPSSQLQVAIPTTLSGSMCICDGRKWVSKGHLGVFRLETEAPVSVFKSSRDRQMQCSYISWREAIVQLADPWNVNQLSHDFPQHSVNVSILFTCQTFIEQDFSLCLMSLSQEKL